jgi:hypothetical protein
MEARSALLTASDHRLWPDDPAPQVRGGWGSASCARSKAREAGFSFRRPLSCPASLDHANDPDQQARADEAGNEVANPSP